MRDELPFLPGVGLTLETRPSLSHGFLLGGKLGPETDVAVYDFFFTSGFATSRACLTKSRAMETTFIGGAHSAP